MIWDTVVKYPNASIITQFKFGQNYTEQIWPIQLFISEIKHTKDIKYTPDWVYFGNKESRRIAATEENLQLIQEIFNVKV